jgi:hypothetical protein
VALLLRANLGATAHKHNKAKMLSLKIKKAAQMFCAASGQSLSARKAD